MTPALCSRPTWRTHRARTRAQIATVCAILVAVGVALWTHLTRATSGPTVGSEAVDFRLPVASGPEDTFRLADHRGTPVVIEVFASWCGYCQRATSVLASASQARRTSQVRFVGVSVDDTIAEAAGAAWNWGIPYEVAWDDGRVTLAYDISMLPTVVVVDGAGRVAHVGNGTPDADELEDWLSDVGAARVN
jgi:peroxiredoxin